MVINIGMYFAKRRLKTRKRVYLLSQTKAMIIVQDEEL